VTYTKLSNNVGKGQQGPRESIELVGGFLDSLRKKGRNEKSFLDYLVSVYR
jgi:hypothetical protein